MSVPPTKSWRRYVQESIGQTIEDFDLLIGITARENNLTVVTHNTKHFSRIEDLNTEDWML